MERTVYLPSHEWLISTDFYGIPGKQVALTVISIIFTLKTSQSCLKSWYFPTFSRPKPEFCVMSWWEFPYFASPFGVTQPASLASMKFPNKTSAPWSFDWSSSLAGSEYPTHIPNLSVAWLEKILPCSWKITGCVLFESHTCERYLSKLKLKSSPIIKIVVGLTQNTAQGLINNTLLLVESRYSSVDNSDIFFQYPPSLVIVVF